MTARTLWSALALAALAVAGCTWPGRPDGGSPRHTTAETVDPLTRQYDTPTPVEPLDGGPAGTPVAAATEGTVAATGAPVTPAAASPAAPTAATP